MKDKIGIAMGIGITTLVLVTLYIYIMSVENIELSEIILVGIVVILVASFSYFLLDRVKSIKGDIK